MNRSGQLLLSTLLLASTGLMLFVLLSPKQQAAFELSRNNRPMAAEENTLEAQPAQDEEIIDTIPLSDFIEMTARPLFSPSRRPPQSVSGEDANDPVSESIVTRVERNQFVVMGIVIAQDEKVALLKVLNSSEEIVHVKEGQTVSGWTVTAITAEAVSLRQNGVTDLIKLSDNVLSDAEKQQLIKQSKQEQIKAVTKQNILNRRSNVSSDRRRVIQSTRRLGVNPRTQNK